jgi:replicative DNA helicase
LSDRTPPPSAPDAERALLGSIFLDASVFGRLNLEPSDFYVEKHRLIYTSMRNVYDREEPIDYITLMTEMENTRTLTRAGGQMYLVGLLGEVPTSLNAMSYAALIEKMAVLRSIISAGARIASLGYDKDQDPEEALRTAESLLMAIQRRQTEPDFVSQDDALDAYGLELQALIEQGQGIQSTIPTGLRDLDRALGGGMRRGELIVLAARPSMGKSGLGLTICTNAAVRASASAAIFSLEMTTSSLVSRMIATQSNVPLEIIKTGRWGDYERKIGATLGNLLRAKIWWNDMSSITVERMRAMLRRHMLKNPIDLVMIDHAQLLHAEGRQENRTQELTGITRALKGLAKDLNVPVILISQLSREVERRTDKRPMLSDLRESGSLEQDADVVLLLYRDDYYNPDSDRTRIADLSIAKQRNGPTSSVALSWIPETTGFWGLERMGL